MQKTTRSIFWQPCGGGKRYALLIPLSVLCGLILLAACQQQTEKPETVATVDQFEITKTDLVNQFRVRHPELPFTTADKNLKQQVLDDMIDQQLIFMEANRLGYDRNSDIKAYIAEKEQELAADAYLDEVTRLEPITEDLLREYHSLLEKVVDVSLIKVNYGAGGQEKQSARQQAFSIFQQWKAGADWHRLTAEHIKNGSPVADSSRYTNIDCFMIDKLLFKRLFSMQVGEISEPVETDEAYYILKLEKVLVQKMADFSVARSEIQEALEKMQQNIKAQKIARVELHLRKQYHLQYFSDHIDVFCDGAKKMTSRSDTASVFSAQEKRLPLSKTDINTITIGEFLPKVAEYYWDSLFQRRVVDMLLEYMNTKRLLKHHAIQLKINERPSLKEQVSLLLVQKIKERVLAKEVLEKIKLSDADLHLLYENNKNKFKVPPQVTVQEIFCRTKSDIDKVHALALNNADFSMLQKKYSQDEETRTHGLLGPFAKGQNGKLGEKAFSGMNVGQISEPFRYRGGFSFFKLLAFEPEHIKSFDAVKDNLKSGYIEEQQNRYISDWIKTVRTKYQIRYYTLP
jgi:parvulin-like peptidyl-prolyl isomerase